MTQTTIVNKDTSSKQPTYTIDGRTHQEDILYRINRNTRLSDYLSGQFKIQKKDGGIDKVFYYCSVDQVKLFNRNLPKYKIDLTFAQENNFSEFILLTSGNLIPAKINQTVAYISNSEDETKLDKWLICNHNKYKQDPILDSVETEEGSYLSPR